jgi:hypothetical protein
MASLWVVSIDLLACLTDFLHDHVRGLTFDDALDRGVFVTWDQNESVGLS